ncbi:MAG: bifunctional oligoribonuclease/PAP phosphatase NrnA [Deltaproteobacteria bacterium]|jgi:bifunctional oligoribonuclease and PAP phosphatase NrnA|nr:MAG: bifunctional oligoribonuclease/PAP phosphatase NrnA [Deltaproteobacteria bacterium]TNF28747.1 MAG: bifunctional oligoribonuclease/PAP phosphatase NrnA [Deltaproteobacteria bacterium]
MRMIERFKSLTKKAKNIVITTHIHPDADGIGSEIALCMALKAFGKNAICVNEVELLDRYKYLDAGGVVMSFDDFRKNHKDLEIDLFIVTDTNSLNRIGSNVQKLVTESRDLLFIDHHPCPRELAKIHCIDTSMAATGELVGALIESIGVKFTKEMALPLYTSILIDTSSFRYPTVTGNTHRLIGKLMDTGVQPPEAYNAIYGTKKITYMQMLGVVLSSARTTDDEKIAWLRLTEKELERYDVDTEDTHGFINHLLILDNIKVACMFRQIDSKVKISLRSAGDIDVGVMAQALGGGGHNHSAATIVEGQIGEVIKETIPKIQMMLDENDD